MRWMLRILSATLALTLGLPAAAQARQGEEELQSEQGSVLLLTRYTDGEGAFPGLARRLYLASENSNGLVGYTFAVAPETWFGRFQLTLDSQSSSDGDLGIYFYSDLGTIGGGTVVTTAEYDVRQPGGEIGFIPPDSHYAIVFMSRGLNVEFTYHGFSPSSVEVSEGGYAPSDVTVGSGGWIVWENVGQDFHSVTADAGAFDSSPNTNQPLISGATFAVQFSTVGDYPYHDKFGTAIGVVHVVPGPGPGTPA